MTTPIETIHKYLAEVKAVREAATPGPWRFAHLLDGIDARMLIDGRGYHFGRSDDLENGIFIAQSPVTQEKLERALAIAVEALDDSEVTIDDHVRNKALADVAQALEEK